MEEQTILGVDESGNFSGEYISKIKAHTGEGISHFAITVFIFNSKGEILLQKRKHEVFDDIWDNTGSTHQLHLKNGHDESDEEATHRCLKNEWGIENVELNNLGGFKYFAKYSNLCENEFCKLLIGNYDGDLKPNLDLMYEFKWMDKGKFMEDLENNPDKYTPWCKVASKILKKKRLLE